MRAYDAGSPEVKTGRCSSVQSAMTLAFVVFGGISRFGYDLWLQWRSANHGSKKVVPAMSAPPVEPGPSNPRVPLICQEGATGFRRAGRRNHPGQGRCIFDR